MLYHCKRTSRFRFCIDHLSLCQVPPTWICTVKLRTQFSEVQGLTPHGSIPSEEWWWWGVRSHQRCHRPVKSSGCLLGPVSGNRKCMCVLNLSLCLAPTCCHHTVPRHSNPAASSCGCSCLSSPQPSSISPLKHKRHHFISFLKPFKTSKYSSSSSSGREVPYDLFNLSPTSEPR